jgi:hypothetical protein
MLEEKKDNLTLFVHSAKSGSGVACGVSFKVKLDSCALNKLDNPSGCSDCFAQYTEEACVCFALYQLAKNKLCGDAASTKKSKVGNVLCSYHNGAFLISWNVKSTAAAIRISFIIVLSCLLPSKVYPIYAMLIKSLGGKPDKETYAYAASSIADSINSSVMCGVVGAIKTVKKVDDKMVKLDIKPMLLQLHKKLNAEAPKGSKAKPSEHTACNHTNVITVKASGWPAVVTQEYISIRVPGINPRVCGDGITIYMPESQWETAKKKLKAFIKTYVDAKYSKIEAGEVSATVAYNALSSASLSTYDVLKLLKENITTSQVSTSINSIL